jgi:hypothetical protein
MNLRKWEKSNVTLTTSQLKFIIYYKIIYLCISVENSVSDIFFSNLNYNSESHASYNEV